MMNRLGYCLALFFITTLNTGISLAQNKSALGKKVDNFTLKDYRGKVTNLADYKDSKIVVLAFLGTECPLVKLYGPRLAALEKQFQGKGVQFIGINANVQDRVTMIAAYAQKHKIEFPILKDLENKLADQLGAQRTPEVFVLDQNRVVQYHGRIDDQYGVGFVRDQPKRKDLEIALEELLAGKQVSQAKTRAEGCFIGRVQKAKGDNSITYSKHIAPILQNRCVECHRTGDIAPFALTKYEEVSGWADTIVEVIEAGRMPPWHANPKYGHFANERKLTNEEKKLIFQWVKNGAPEGDPKDLPKPLTYVSGWQLPRQPDAVFPLTKTPHKVPATGTVKYVFFRVDPGFKEDKWVEGAQIIPGVRAVVHHVLVWAVPRDKLKEIARDIGEGGAGFLAGYVPGQRAYPFPKGMAKRIPAGSELIFQVHYTPIGTEQFDQSKLGLIFADPKTITHEVKTKNVVQRFLFIPPGKADFKVQASSKKGLEESLLLGFMPHMHLRGKSFQYTAIFPDGKENILLDVPHYDFNWQTSYRLTEPLKLPAGTKFACTAYYDNSEGNLNNPNPKNWVRWGSQTWDEMMIGYFDVAIPLKQVQAK